MTKRKCRKPKPLKMSGYEITSYWSPHYVSLKAVHGSPTGSSHERHTILTSEECRKLALWLTKAADWIDQTEDKP